MQVLQATESETMNAFCRYLTILPTPTAKKKNWLKTLLQLIGSILAAIWKGLRAVWNVFLTASEARCRQMEAMDGWRSYHHF